MSLNTCVQAHFFLLKDRLFVPKLFAVIWYLRLSALLVNQSLLISNPTLLCLSYLVIDLPNLVLYYLLFILQRTCVFFTITVLFRWVSKLSIKTIYFELFLRNIDMAVFDFALLITNFSFFIFELADEFIKFLLQEFILALSVKVINLDTWYFVTDIFNFDLFSANAFVRLLCLFK